MKRPAIRRDAPRRAAPWCRAVLLLVVSAGCEPLAVPSQVLARSMPRADTLAAPRSDTASAGVDSAVALPVGDSAAVRDDSSGTTATLAELPRQEVDVTYPAAVRTIRVAPDADLQTVIDSAMPGDVLLLPPGATYVGNYVLPDKGSSEEWIVFRTDVSDAELGAPGIRMTPSRAAGLRLAAIVSPNATSPIVTRLSAHHYRFTGIEISAEERVGDINALVRFGDDGSGQRSVETTAHHLVIDRSYVHGAPTLQLRRCVMLNSATSAVVDSWLADCHSNVSDSQAIVGWNGPGPYLIQNNHLEAGHEVVLFGGGGVTTPGVSPSDVTIRGNRLTRPLAWKGIWLVKNLLETKHVRRMLVEGNVLENNWADAQVGFAFVIKSENQNGDTPWTQSTDVTIRYNRIRNTGSGWNVAANPASAPAVRAARIVITDNVLEEVNTPSFPGDGHTLQLLGGVDDMVFAHNTVVSANGGSASALVLGALPRAARLTVHSNVLVHGAYGVKGGGTSEGRSSLAAYASNALFARNVLVGGGTESDYPAENYFAPSLADVGFADVARGDYRLATPDFRGKGIDGRDIGADFARVERETSGAIVAP